MLYRKMFGRCFCSDGNFFRTSLIRPKIYVIKVTRVLFLFLFAFLNSGVVLGVGRWGSNGDQI